jgi:stage V sporulation protein SpoVS
VTSISSSSGGSTTSYFYVISPDLQNPSSTFYQSQCGNYNSQTNPNGFISGANLLTDTTRHESGTVQSHYENYVVAQSSPANNLGAAAEAMTGKESGQALANSATTALNQNVEAITSATQVEPCGVQYNASCTFQGFINFQPYQSCN